MTSASAVRGLIARQLQVSLERVTPGAALKVDLGADSLDHLEMVMALEAELSVYISDAQAERMVTVKDVIDFVDETKREKGL